MADLAGECFEQVSDHLQAACDLIALAGSVALAMADLKARCGHLPVRSQSSAFQIRPMAARTNAPRSLSGNQGAQTSIKSLASMQGTRGYDQKNGLQ
jgi:hypothetical protein